MVRHARSDLSNVSTCVLLPQLGSAATPDHFMMLSVPFQGEGSAPGCLLGFTYNNSSIFCAEDIRTCTFPPLVPSADLQPDQAQVHAAMALVLGMDLAASSRTEVLKPEATANPVLQRLYRALGNLVLEGKAVTERAEQVGLQAIQLTQGELCSSVISGDRVLRIYIYTCTALAIVLPVPPSQFLGPIEEDKLVQAVFGPSRQHMHEEARCVMLMSVTETRQGRQLL